MAYDCLKLKIGSPVKQAKEYLEILYLAARGTESEVDNVLRILFDRGESISVDRVKSLLDKNNSDNQAVEWFHQVLVKDVDLSDYDQLLSLSLSFSFPDAIATASAGSAASAMQMSEVEVSHGY